jgi:hypothetical protein
VIIALGAFNGERLMTRYNREPIMPFSAAGHSADVLQKLCRRFKQQQKRAQSPSSLWLKALAAS